ncbi:YT521-B-like domain-domain-containing protein [Clohesyomyces aquaticus]|uniref:YT521-B-like domain-domain-containing protein n=1 Tax=Clohesyomyces aquaticus TaxID=1231657 RepID=A0A1Y1ZPF0_9PLEO|nr:YT521-B-like domain-domain-containing protein [Clohesyomyces aquaticus]
MVGALPEYTSMDPGQGHNPQSHQQIPRTLSGASTSALVYQMQHNLQMPSHAPGIVPTHSSYGPGFGQGQFQQNFIPVQAPQHTGFGSYHGNQQRLGGGNQPHNPYQNFHQPSPYVYYTAPYGPQGQFPQGFPPQAVQSQVMFGRRPSQSSGQAPLMGQNIDPSQHEGSFTSANRMIPGGPQGEMGPLGAMGMGLNMQPRPAPASSIPRGPPRKPKQSGHALWVGNLPPGTTVVDLKDHFSRDATKDIESLFLISKSNCAFVNYRTEESCTAAMHRFHDSRFHGVRLVCRLRRSSAPASGVPTGPSAMSGSQPANTSPPKSPRVGEGEDGQGEVTEPAPCNSGEASREASTAAEKYFIVKSLTLQDLELSVRNGIWATQSHNEDVLNKAFQTAENVYLIFSANKSGEYFGYARMASPILEDATQVMGSAPKPETNIVDATDVPKSIPTAATEFAPKGRIIDDSARGTIFWEAQLSDDETEDQPDTGKEKEVEPVHEGDMSPTTQTWGKPFKIEWMSTNRLPFYRTRGLRNPWNANREVKIARDGTELETSVGERLIQMFHRLGPSSAQGPAAGGAPQNMMSNQMGAGMGMRPF